MEVRIDGSRSSSENWLRASLAPISELPKLTSEEEQVAQKLGIAPEPYARERYAQELTDSDLRDRAVKFGNLVQAWLDDRQLTATVESVWLKTFEGKYRVELSVGGKFNLVFVDESLIDEIFEQGSIHARSCLAHILEANLFPAQAVRAS
jgi:hypothetical protein